MSFLKSPKMTPWFTFGVFAIVAVMLIFGLQRQGNPWPMFISLTRDTPEQLIEFSAEKPASITFNSRSDLLRGAHFEVLFPDKKNPIRLTAFRQANSEKIGETLVGVGTGALIEFDVPVFEDEVIEIRFEVTVPKPWKPKLKKLKAGIEPIQGYEMLVTVGGENVEGFVPTVLLYRSNYRGLLWLWPVVLLGTAFVIWRPKFVWPWLVILGVCCVVTSWHGWTQRYATHYGSMDPDRYGAMGSYLAEWLTDSEERAHWQKNLRDYQHSHVFLVPVILAGMILAGLEMHDAYLLLNALVSFAAMLLFFRLLHRKLGLNSAISVVGVLVFACHLVFLRSFARPTTDQMAMLLVIAMLSLLIDRLRESTARQNLAIVSLAILLAFVRPPGIVYAAFLLGMTPFCDCLREGKLNFLDRILTFAKIALPAIAVVGGFYLAFDLVHHFRLAMEKNKTFIDQWTLKDFWIMSVVVVQAFFIGWAFLRYRGGAWKPVLVLALWLVLHTLLLVVAKAAFIPRLGIPILPSVLALCCLGLDRFREKRVLAGISYALFIVIAAGNVWIMNWCLNQPSEPKTPWRPYIYR